MYIKYIILVFSLFVVLSNSMFAQTKDESNDVKALIDKVKQAPPSERRLLMNELKIKLRSMQQETRTQVMLGLRSAFNAQQTQQHLKTDAMTSSMSHQNTMSMTEAKHMQEHMSQDSMPNSMPTKPPRNKPTQNTPPKPPRAHVPIRGN